MGWACAAAAARALAAATRACSGAAAAAAGQIHGRSVVAPPPPPPPSERTYAGARALAHAHSLRVSERALARRALQVVTISRVITIPQAITDIAGHR